MQLTTKLQELLINSELINVIEIICDEIDDIGQEYPLIWEWNSGELTCSKNGNPLKVVLDLERIFDYPPYQIKLRSHRGLLSLG